MTKSIYKNELRKREFFDQLEGAEGFEESSLNKFAEAIGQWQVFSENEDFANFNKTKAKEFVEWLKKRASKTLSGQISPTTQYHYLRHLRRFLKWLSEQPNYRKIPKNDIDFLRLSKKENRIATSGTKRPIPTLEEIKKIIESIEIKNEIDKRDRAIICLAVITGIRVSALISLKMKSLDKRKKIIYQNPADGVKTKGAKDIQTPFFSIGWDKPEPYFIEWYEYLEAKGFQAEDPIFPSTLNEFRIEGNIYNKELVSKKFWSGEGGIIKILKKRCENANVPYFNPHSFRHSVVNIFRKRSITEEQKKAFSLCFGHANIGTTFGSYGYGHMSNENAVEIMQKLNDQDSSENKGSISAEEKAVLERIIKRS
jgi:integrase